MSCVCGCESSFSDQRLDVCVGVSKRPDVITFVSGIEKSKKAKYTSNRVVGGIFGSEHFVCASPLSFRCNEDARIGVEGFSLICASFC